MQKSTVTSDPVKFVSDLEIAYPKHRVESESFNFLRNAKENAEDGKAESYLNDKSIISFVSNVSGQTRQDVLNSTLIAQLAANKKNPKDEDVINWFETYKETLGKIGWDVQGKEFLTFNAKTNAFEMEAVILEILGAAFSGAAFIPIVIKTIDALKTLSNSNKKIIAFEKNTHSLTKGAFVIAVVDETNNAASMKLGAFILSTTSQINQILFFKSSKDSTELKYTSSDCTFSEDVYNSVRKPILEKLGNEAQEFVSAIEI